MGVVLTPPDGSRHSEIIVRSASQLSGNLLSDRVYVLDGTIDMGAASITVPQGGLTLKGTDVNLSGLTSSEASHTMFVDDGVYSGRLFCRDMLITVSGAGSKVFDLDNDENGGAFEFSAVNFNFCTSLGLVSNYRQALFDNVGIIGCVDGLEFDGNMSGGIAMLTTILVSAGTDFTGTLLKKGSALSIGGSVRSDINALQLDDDGTLCDFEPSNIVNDDEFRMSGVRVNPASDAFPNMPSSSVKARFSNCVGVDNTHVGIQWVITSEATTTISSANTPVKIAGTTTYTDAQWFSGPSSNAATYISSQRTECEIKGTLAFTGGANDELNVIVRQWDNSASAYIDLSETGVFAIGTGGRANSTALLGYSLIDENDRIEIWVENQSDSSDVTCELGGLVSITERSS